MATRLLPNVKKLLELIPPPENPTAVGSDKKWEQVEKQLDTPLPKDYRQLVTAYGTGLFAGMYRIYNPWAKSPYSSIAARVRGQPEIARPPDNDEYCFFPEDGGLLTWGNDENGNFYYWSTGGRPDKWTVVECEERGCGYRAHPCTLSEFLLGILEKKIKPLASGYPRKSNFAFAPFSDDD